MIWTPPSDQDQLIDQLYQVQADLGLAPVLPGALLQPGKSYLFLLKTTAAAGVSMGPYHLVAAEQDESDLADDQMPAHVPLASEVYANQLGTFLQFAVVFEAPPDIEGASVSVRLGLATSLDAGAAGLVGENAYQVG